MPKPATPLYIDAVKHVRAVASPVRAAAVDALEVIGPATVAQLAEVLGYPPDGLYYHVAALKRLGLVIEVEPEKGAAASRFDVRGRPVTLRYRLNDRAQGRAMSAVVSTMLRSAARGFQRAYVPGFAQVDGPNRNLRAGRRTAWLTSGELRVLNRYIERIHTMFGQGRPQRRNARLHEFTYVLSPSLPAGRRLTRRHYPTKAHKAPKARK